MKSQARCGRLGAAYRPGRRYPVRKGGPGSRDPEPGGKDVRSYRG
jgi:hypothetical protein